MVLSFDVSGGLTDFRLYLHETSFIFQQANFLSVLCMFIWFNFVEKNKCCFCLFIFFLHIWLREFDTTMNECYSYKILCILSANLRKCDFNQKRGIENLFAQYVVFKSKFWINYFMYVCYCICIMCWIGKNVRSFNQFSFACQFICEETDRES